MSLHHLHLRENRPGDVEARFRAAQDYATANGFAGGFPDVFHARTSVLDPFGGGRREEIVCGTVLLRQEKARWPDILLFREPDRPGPGPLDRRPFRPDFPQGVTGVTHMS